MIPTEPAEGSDSPFFESLQDSRAKMQDSKGVFGVFRVLILRRRMAVYFMGEYRTVLAGDCGGGCGLGRLGECSGLCLLSWPGSSWRRLLIRSQRRRFSGSSPEWEDENS